ncbi:hypothetical protein ACTHGU_08460 [Chitinophagaceae bacterium MMS25-I14]
MMRKILLPLFILSATAAQSQELFPLSEPASNMPKGVAGIRVFDQSYKEVNNKYRNLFGLKLMYGITSRLSVYLTGTVSNHHSAELPPSFPDHNTPQVGVDLPCRFNGVDLYAKYRFLSKDGEHTHLRVAAYGEYSYLKVAHDEAEPTLMDDTKGWGAGLIGTYLKKRFAVSITGGFILPADYTGAVPDYISGLPSVPAKVKYGKAVNYSVSFGYLLLPRKYKSYDQVNWNLYMEFIGKSYESAKVYFDNLGQPGTPYQVVGSGQTVLNAGHYIELHPGLQAIIQSNLRLDVSVGFPIVNRSYTRYYPVYTLGIQRYFF